MPDTVDADCGGTLELTHDGEDLDHDSQAHVDPYYVLSWITRRERF
jgi:hypothetical protein